jgi:CRISPR/Cas system CSM-associated protein Csm3 (group 7 of RAMP superfamily)
MNQYRLKIKLESDTLIGSGMGLGTLIDTDVVFGNDGIPYIPSKRIKGTMRDAAKELQNCLGNPKDVDTVFGTSSKMGIIQVSDLYPTGYEENIKPWLAYLSTKSNSINDKSIINFFTSIRRQTKIDTNTGVAEEHSLRTSRVLKSGIEFEGKVTLLHNDSNFLSIVCIAIANMRHIGTMRNRGFGTITSQLFDQNNIDITEQTIKELRTHV